MLKDIIWFVSILITEMFTAVAFERGIHIITANESAVKKSSRIAELILRYIFVSTWIIIAALYKWVSPPSHWVWWALVIGTVLLSLISIQEQHIIAGLFYLVLSPVIWYVFLHLSLFVPAPASNTPVPQTAIEQQAAKSS